MSDRFATLAAEFESLQRDLERTNDPALRRALLIELRTKLDLIQQTANRVRDELNQAEE